jgi:glycosyltransferase involved in cell wall biosynthesis
MLFVSWAFVQGRSGDIASSLGGRASPLYLERISDRRYVLLRYALTSVLTVGVLLRHRPRSVIVTNPPIIPGLICAAYGRLAGAPVVLDSHTGSFGLKGDTRSKRLLPVHAWLARRVAAVLVTTDELGDVVSGWGGRPLVVHEAPPAWSVAPPGPLPERPKVLFVGVFANDEPVGEVIEAARLLPECDVLVTGKLTKAPAGLVESAPPNVRFVGFLPADGYRDLVEQADVMISLTTEPVSVMRAAYEAVYARRPLVISGWPVLEKLFPHAVPVTNDRDGIAAGVRTVISDHDRYLRATDVALDEQRRRWDEQIDALRAVLTQDRTARPLDVKAGA